MKLFVSNYYSIVCGIVDQLTTSAEKSILALIARCEYMLALGASIYFWNSDNCHVCKCTTITRKSVPSPRCQKQWQSGKWWSDHQVGGTLARSYFIDEPDTIYLMLDGIQKPVMANHCTLSGLSSSRLKWGAHIWNAMFQLWSGKRWIQSTNTLGVR